MGRPVEAQVTSLRGSSRSGAADDNFLELDDGSSVPVGLVNRGRLRYIAATPGFEASYEGGAFVPLGGGGGWERWIYLDNTATYADIQAALNDAAYEGVFLAAGTYNITGNLVIPNGKILSAVLVDTDPAVAANVILNLTSGFQIRVQRGTLQYCRVTTASASSVQSVTCVGGRVVHVHVTTTAGVGNATAFYGNFAELGWCSANNQPGVDIPTSLSATIGQWQNIHNIAIVRGNTLGYGFNVAANYVSIRDLKVDGGDYGIRLNGGAGKSYLYIENILATGTVNTFGIQIAAYTYVTAIGIMATTNLGISINTCYQSTFDGLLGTLTTGTSIALINSAQCHFSNVSAYNVTSSIGMTISGNGDCTFDNISLITMNKVGGSYGIYIDSGNGKCIFNDFYCFQARGSATTHGIGAFADQCTYSNFYVYNCQGAGFYVSAVDKSNFSNIQCEGNDWASGQIYITSCTTSTFINLSAHTSAGPGIRVDSCTDSTFSILQSIISVNYGIQVSTCTTCLFTSLKSRQSTGIGISLGTPGTPGSINTDCSFSGLDARQSTTAGISAQYLSDCQVSNINSYSNTGNGVTSTNNTNTQFAVVRSNSNTGHGVAAGSSDSYCTWTDIHIQNSGAASTNFFGTAATATCYYNGGFEQQGGAAANNNFPLANWTTTNILSIP